MYDIDLFETCFEQVCYDNAVLEGLYNSPKMVAAIDKSVREKIPGRTKAVYVMLSFSNTFWGRITVGVTRGTYSHASLVLDKKFKDIYAMVDEGLVKEQLNLRGYVNDSAKYALYEIKVTPKEYNKIVEFVELLKSRNTKYDNLGFYLSAFNIKHNNGKTYICSGFVNSALEYAGIKVFNKSGNLVRPDDFMYNENFKLVKNGLFEDLRKELGVSNEPIDNYNPDLYK